jgi:hypothetical protein
MLVDEDFEIELHGLLELYPVRDLTGDEPDLFSLMFTRASMLGWSSPASSLLHRPRLWHPASAEIEDLEPQHAKVMWAHVIPEDVPAAAPALMVQPVARCLADCVERLGSLRLSEVHIAAAVGDPVNLAEIYGAQWFREAEERISVNVTLELVHTEEAPPPPSASTEVKLIETVRQVLDALQHVQMKPLGRELIFLVPHWSVEVSSWLSALVLATLSTSGLPPGQRLRIHLSPEGIKTRSASPRTH